jgi:hypothetical protein
MRTRAWPLWAGLAAAGCASGPSVVAPTPTPAAIHTASAPPPPPPPPPALPVCRRPPEVPPEDDESIYGMGVGPTIEDAKHRGIADAATRREVTIRAQLTDRQVDWQVQAKGDGSRARGGYEQTVVQESQALAEGRFRGCAPAEDLCLDAGQVRALMRCERPGRGFERELIKIGKAVGSAVPASASLIVIPATNDGGWITELGEYASRILRNAIDGSLPGSARLRSVPRWDPTELHEVARRYKATHAIQAEHVSAGGTRMLFRAWVVDLATEQPVPRSEASFQFDLEPEQQQMIAVRGPLFPNRDAWALASNRGEPLEIRVLHPELREGENVQLAYSIPNDAYLYLFDIYEDGRAALLVPNPALTNNRAAAGVRYVIPDDAWRSKAMDLIACPLPGRAITRETLKLIAAPTPLDLDVARFTGPDMVTLEGGPQGKLADVRAALDRLRLAGVPIREGSAAYTVRAVAGKTRCK